MHVSGPFWDFIGLLNDNFNNLGFLIIGIFVLAWVISVFMYRYRDYDRLEVRHAVAPAPENHYQGAQRR